MKKLILVTSPPGCGKTTLSKKLAAALKHVVYLDKDTLIVLSRQIFVAAGQEYNRSSDFFETYIRDYEYKAIIDLALDALVYDDIVLINAPFTREIRSPEYMNSLKKRLAEMGARLTVIWIVTEPEVCHQRMLERNSDRDTWKLAHWDEFLKANSFEVPTTIDDPNDANDLLLFYNSTDQLAEQSMKEILPILEGL